MDLVRAGITAVPIDHDVVGFPANEGNVFEQGNIDPAGVFEGSGFELTCS
jgi:hypothetical protein